MKIFILTLLLPITLSAAPFRYKRVVNGTVTNSWTDLDQPAGSAYREPGWDRQTYTIVIEDMSDEIASAKAKKDAKVQNVTDLKDALTRWDSLTPVQQQAALKKLLSHVLDKESEGFR